MGFLRKYIFPILFGVIFFSLFKNHLPKFKVLSALETIDLLKKNDKLSLVRFGDGEFDIIAQKRGPNLSAPQGSAFEDFEQQEHLRGRS